MVAEIIVVGLNIVLTILSIYKAHKAENRVKRFKKYYKQTENGRSLYLRESDNTMSSPNYSPHSLP